MNGGQVNKLRYIHTMLQYAVIRKNDVDLYVQILVPLLISCVTTGKLLHFSVSQSPICKLRIVYNHTNLNAPNLI